MCRSRRICDRSRSGVGPQVTTVRDQAIEVRRVMTVRSRVPFEADCVCAREGLVLSMPGSRSGEFLDRL